MAQRGKGESRDRQRTASLRFADQLPQRLLSAPTHAGRVAESKRQVVIAWIGSRCPVSLVRRECVFQNKCGTPKES